ncbi:MAG: hypothetical protein QG646_1555 [Euryarchaeota archaeon]|nr:hypothetical protein [Euryarchaeota archaeon]
MIQMYTMFKDGTPNASFILSEHANDVLRYNLRVKIKKLHEELRKQELDVSSSAMFANDVFGYQLSVFFNGDIENCDINKIIECISKVILNKQEITDDECKAVVSGYGIFRALKSSD